MERKIIITKDGSKTIHFPALNESYHSQYGALQEALHVFIQSGLVYRIDNNTAEQELNILEVGWGTGLNAILTFDFVQQYAQKVKINYTGLEAFPIEMEELEALEYWNLAPIENHRQVFLDMHSAEWNKRVNLSPNFTFQKLKTTIQAWQLKNNTTKHFDLIFYDAFGPRVQPEMWSSEIFDKLFSWTKNDGVFVTYCSKGQVRRDLIAAGYKMEKIPGPPGKREMLRGVKKV